jgi:hypothetical protein
MIQPCPAFAAPVMLMVISERMIEFVAALQAGSIENQISREMRRCNNRATVLESAM